MRRIATHIRPQIHGMQRFFAKFQIRPVRVIRQTQHAVFAADRRDALYIRNIPEVIGRSDVYGGGKSARAESLFQFLRTPRALTPHEITPSARFSAACRFSVSSAVSQNLRRRTATSRRNQATPPRLKTLCARSSRRKSKVFPRRFSRAVCFSAPASSGVFAPMHPLSFSSPPLIRDFSFAYNTARYSMARIHSDEPSQEYTVFPLPNSREAFSSLSAITPRALYNTSAPSISVRSRSSAPVKKPPCAPAYAAAKEFF